MSQASVANAELVMLLSFAACMQKGLLWGSFLILAPLHKSITQMCS